MPRFLHHPERPPIVEKKELTKELKEYPELKAELTFPFPLNENRKEALEMIYHKEKVEEEKVVNLLESKDFIEKRVGLYLLKDAPPLSDKGYERAIAILDEMRKDKDRDVQGAVLQAEAKVIADRRGEKAPPFVVEMRKDEDLRVQEPVAKAAAWTEVKVIVNTQGEKALPILEEMAKDKDRDVIREAVAQALPHFGENALPILEEMRKDKSAFVVAAAVIAIMEIKRYKWFLATQKPLFATPFTQELAKRVLKLQKITKELKKKFRDKFVGLTIFGSTTKGYFRPRSDLDWAIIAQSRECSSRFKEMAKDLNLCPEHYAGINEKYQIMAHEEVLFSGLFFGDDKKLLKIQRQLLKSIDEKKWDEIRRIIMENEINLSKEKKRFGLKDDEIKKITQASLLLRVPPSLKETLEIVEKRIKKAA